MGWSYDGRKVREDRSFRILKSVMRRAALFAVDTVSKAALIIIFYLLFSSLRTGFKP
jgi:hypothetical protein